MLQGFFAPSQLRVEAPEAVAPRCSACGIYKACLSPKMPPTGAGNLRVLIVGEAPGANEDEVNSQFVGQAGLVLRAQLRRIGVDLEDCIKTNAIICRPPENREPTDAEVGHCAPNLAATIKEHAPHVIIPLGGVALKAVIGRYWKEAVGPMGQWAGTRIPLIPLNAWVCPTWHPSYILRSRKNDRPDEALELWWGRHLAAAFELAGAPPYYCNATPDYKSKIKIIMEQEVAARYIDKMIAEGGPSAFDYECNMLKPEDDRAAIYSCSISWRGRVTIAYPWTPVTREATRRFIVSPLPKIASNMKFEERWTKHEFGHGVRNWRWDTMQMAHVGDQRQGIASIKFQSFTRLGVPVYNDHIEPYLTSPGSRTLNRIHLIDMRDLLLYNGYDSLFEHIVADQQANEFGEVL